MLESNPEKILRKSHMKVTRGRCTVLDYLMQQHQPVSIEELAEKVPTVNLTTIYRMLRQFVQKNIIYQTDFRSGKSFFEYQHEHHHHITCTDCGKQEAINICLAASHNDALRKAQDFTTITSHSLEFFGICEKCKA